LAGGVQVHANATSHADLFWMARGGGGGQFPAVALAFHFALTPLPAHVAYLELDVPRMQARATLEAWEHLMLTAAHSVFPR